MKISQFNPRNESARFCPIVHPVNNEPLVDEQGVEVGFDVYSVNSKAANQSQREMQNNILQRKQELATSMGRPDFGVDPDPDQQEVLTKWDADNKEAFEAKARDIVSEELLDHIGRCCGKIHGSIELDDGTVADTAIQVLNDQEWVADQILTFHRNLSNWVPKQQGS